MDFLPEKMVSKDIQNSIHTRAEFNRQLKSLQRFLKPGAEKTISTPGGVKTTVWQKKEASLAVRKINRERAKRAAKASTEKGTMGTIESWNLSPKSDFAWEKPRTQEDWKSFLEGVKHQASDTYWSKRDETYRNNYLAAVEEAWGKGYREQIETIIRRLGADDVVGALEYSPRLNIEFVYQEYGDSDSEMAEMWEDMINTWLDYVEETKGEDLRFLLEEELGK